MDMIEGYKNPNRFYIYYRDFENNKSYVLFSCKEMSSYLVKNCIIGDVRPMQLNIKHIKTKKIKDDNYNKDNNYAIISKPFQMNCLCCSTVSTNYFKNLNGPKYGTVIQKFTLGDPIFQILNSNENVMFTITTNCCKTGYLLRGSYGKFDPVVLYIFKGERTSSINKIHNGINIDGQSCGKIIKHLNGIRTVLNEEDTYEVIFPEDISSEDKMNIISAALMIDYLYFEENSFNV